MFYDSDDDDEHFVFGYNGYGEFAYGGFRLDFGDWMDFGGYYSDEYDDEFSLDDSDYSDYSYSSNRSIDAFYEVCHSPSLFPDVAKFPVEFARRVSKIRSAHKYSLLETAEYRAISSVTEKLDIPIFEHLWECLFYLKQIITVALDRIEIPMETSGVNKGIANIWNSSIDCISALRGADNGICNNFFVWCNDLLIESLQSLIPIQIPYTAWEFIVFHLSSDSSSTTRKLLTQIGTISRDRKTQIVERLLVRDCILRSADLTRVLYRILYSRQSSLNVDQVKQKLPLLLNGFSISMERFMCFLESSEPSSKCINHSVKNQFSLYINDQFCKEPDLAQDEFDLLKMVGASSGYQNGSSHFTMFIADSEDSEEEDLYHLLCIDKNCIDKEITSYIFVSGAIRSEKPPLLFSCESLVAGVGFEDKNKKTLTVWDVSDEEPFKGQGEVIFHSEFEGMTSSWKKIDPQFNSSFFLNDDVKIVGIARFDKTIKLMFSIIPFCSEASERHPSCMIAEYELDKFVSKFPFFKSKLQQSYFPNAMPLGIHKNMAFIMDLETSILFVYDINQAYKVVITKVSLDCGQDWKIQFNSNPDAKSCLLYKGNHLQIRELDEELTLVHDISLDLDHLSQHYHSFEFQFCNSVLYGFLNFQENLHETKDKFLEYNDGHIDPFYEDFLSDRFANAHVVHFLVDLDSDDKEVHYLDFDSNVSECGDRFVDSINNYASVDIQFCLTGFNKRQELVQLFMKLDVEEVESDDDKLTAMCSEFKFSTVQFYEEFKDMTKSMLPDVEKVITRHETEVAEVEAQKKREQELIEKLLKETQEQNRKREAKKAKEEQRKQRKWQQRIKADKDRKAKEVEQPSSSAQGPSSSKDESELVVEVKEHIARGTVFTSTITAWLPHKRFGFSTIDVKAGKQSVFVHESSFVSHERRNVTTGSVIQFQLRWNQIHPRPKAVNVKLL